MPARGRSVSPTRASSASQAWTQNFGVTRQWDPSLPLSKWGVALKVDDEAGYGALDQNFGLLWDTFDEIMKVVSRPKISVQGMLRAVL